KPGSTPEETNRQIRDTPLRKQELELAAIVNVVNASVGTNPDTLFQRMNYVFSRFTGNLFRLLRVK
ncbi:MAG TPA: hypothetical protein VEY10_03290, partial [Flavisolibacter sp.]|nr:hypothetical protein [Flavisolibacter sp.]